MLRPRGKSPSPLTCLAPFVSLFACRAGIVGADDLVSDRHKTCSFTETTRHHPCAVARGTYLSARLGNIRVALFDSFKHDTQTFEALSRRERYRVGATQHGDYPYEKAKTHIYYAAIYT